MNWLRTHAMPAWPMVARSSSLSRPNGPSSVAPSRFSGLFGSRASSSTVPDRMSCSPMAMGNRLRPSGGGGPVRADRVELLVLLAGVDPVLELDDAELPELLAQPALLAFLGARVEQPQLLAVR